MGASAGGGRRWIRWALALGAACVTACFALAFKITQLVRLPFGDCNDKVEHVAAFALLAAIVTGRGPAPRALIALIAFALTIEAVQLVVPERQADLADLAASLAGIALGWLGVGASRTGSVRGFEKGR